MSSNLTLVLAVLFIPAVVTVVVLIEEAFKKRRQEREWRIWAKEQGWIPVPKREPRGDDWRSPGEIDFEAARADYWAERSSAAERRNAPSS